MSRTPDYEQRCEDWLTVVLGWIDDLDRAMDEARAAGDDRAYLVASRQQDAMRAAIRVIDPTGPFRRTTVAFARSLKEAGEAAHRAAETFRRVTSSPGSDREGEPG